MEAASKDGGRSGVVFVLFCADAPVTQVMRLVRVAKPVIALPVSGPGLVRLRGLVDVRPVLGERRGPSPPWASGRSSTSSRNPSSTIKTRKLCYGEYTMRGYYLK